METASLQGKVSDEEWRLRVDLAACYRLVALYGMSDLIFTHISLRLPDHLTGGQEQFLINPYGLYFDEMTASSLVRIDMDGSILSDTPYAVNRAGFVIHSTIHAARHDVQCVLHCHTRAGVAVSAQRDGLLPLSQQASLVLTSLAHHDYEGLAVYDDERERLRRDLGTADFLLLRNHGLLTVGRSVAEAFVNMYFFESACQIQLGAQAGGVPLTHIRQEVLEGVCEAVSRMGESSPAGRAWPGLLRRLDRLNPGYAS